MDRLGLRLTPIPPSFHHLNQKREPLPLNDLAASFQKQAIKSIEIKLARAIQTYHPKTLTVGGGVSANSWLRTIIQQLGAKYGLEQTIIPDLAYCTDNGAMIAKLAYEKQKVS